MADLNPILSFISDSLGFNRQSQVAQTQTNARQAELGTEQEAVLSRASTNAQTVEGQKGRGELAAQTAARNIASQFGGNQEDANSLLALLGQQFRENTVKTSRAMERVAELDATSLLDNPLAWLSNQYEAYQLEGEAAATQDAANFASTAMQQINATISSGAQAQKAIAKTMTEESIAADLALKADEFKAKSIELQRNNLDKNMSGILALESGNARGIELERTKLAALHSEESLAMQKAHLAIAEKAAIKNEELQKLNLEHARLTVEQQRQQNKDREDVQKAMEYEGHLYELGRAALELPAIDTQGKGIVPILAAEKSTKEGAARTQIILEAGAAKAAGAVAVPFGNRPSDALLKVSISGATFANNPDVAKNVRFLQESANYLREAKDATGNPLIPKGAKPEDIKAMLDTEVKNKLKVMQTNVESTGSIYVAPKLPKLAGMGEVKATALFQKVLAPQIATNNGDTSFESIWQLGQKAVDDKVISPAEFIQGVTQVFKSSIDYNNFHSNLNGLGLPLQTSYNIITKDHSGNNMSIDASKQEQVAKLFLQRLLATTGLPKLLSMGGTLNETLAPFVLKQAEKTGYTDVTKLLTEGN